MERSSPIGPVVPSRRSFDALTILLFLAVVLAPTVDRRVRPDSARSPEQRELRAPAAKPARPRSLVELAHYPARYEEYFKDSFGLRDVFLRWNSIVKVFGFGVSPSSEVFFGKQGWIFYTGEHSQDNHRGAYPFPARLLERWGEVLEQKRAQVEALGGRYLYVIAPDKETVYADLLPDFMRPIGPTRREQLLEFMKVKHPRVEILDLTDVLIAAKRDDARGEWVYGNLGTHWTGRGSVVALRALLERLDALVGGVAPGDVDAFERVEFQNHGDSWTPRMYIGDLLEQSAVGYKPPRVRSKVRYEGKFRIGRVRKSTLEGSPGPRVVMIHDSFGPHLELGLSEQCSYLECHWDVAIDQVELEVARPDVFVDLHVERLFNHLLPEKLLSPVESVWSKRFAASETSLVALDKSLPEWGVAGLGGATVGPAWQFPNPRLLVTLDGPSSRITLPALSPIDGEIPVLHATIDSPVGTELVLFYRPPGAADFLRRNSYRKALRVGTNDFYLPLDEQGTGGDLQLKPGDQPGAYLLRELEIRSVSVP